MKILDNCEMRLEYQHSIVMVLRVDGINFVLPVSRD